MKLFSSYNKMGGKRGACVLLIVSLAVLLFLFLVQGGRFSGLSDRLTETVEQGRETAPATEGIVRPDHPEGTLEVHFLDVGHGDSTLIICGEHAMMIDCGDDTQGRMLQKYLADHDVAELDYLILTHPDKDHIGGAPAVLAEFSVGQVFQSAFRKGSETEEMLQQTLKNQDIDAVTPIVGAEYQLGEAWFTILAPNGTYEESNDSSVALLLHFGENTFLFTGDAEKEAEEDMVENSEKPGVSLKADVYHVGHHGDKSSSKKKFLRAVSPEYAVISCDYQGEKGLPDAELLERMREADIKVFRTDEQGTVVAISDGRDITWDHSPSESWQAGKPEEEGKLKTLEKPEEEEKQKALEKPEEEWKQEAPERPEEKEKQSGRGKIPADTAGMTEASDAEKAA